MPRPLLIGLTGGIGSGKSLVAKIFTNLNVPIYDADSRAKRLMINDLVLIDEIKKEFGASAYREDGSLNREFLVRTVFINEEKLRALNQLVHPRVLRDTEKWVEENSSQNYLIKEAALLFESGSNKFLDKIIVVTAPEEVRIQRVITRDARNREEVERIILNQMQEADKITLADYMIVNDDTALVIPQVLKLHERFNSCINK